MTDISRRQFGKALLSSAAGISAALAFPSLLPAFDTNPNDSGVMDKPSVISMCSEKLKRVNNDVPKENIIPFLDQGVMKITGKPTAVSAWKSLFASDEKVGLKLSCLPGKPLSSSVGLVLAIVNGLKLCGIKESNIYIWERTERELERAGFSSSNPLFKGLNVVGTDFLGNDGYLETIEFAGSVGTRFSWIMERVDALINVPVLKDHDLSGVSAGMKNFYGAIYNPNKFHRNNCNPYVAELSTHPLIRNKLRLIVCDATRVQVHNGPAFFPKYAWEYGGLLVSRDPVALDYAGWQLIETGRKNSGLNTLKEAGREPVYIFTGGKLGLGKIEGEKS